MSDVGHSMRPSYRPGTEEKCCFNCKYAENKAQNLVDGTVDCLKVHPDGAVAGDHPGSDMVCDWWEAKVVA